MPCVTILDELGDTTGHACIRGRAPKHPYPCPAQKGWHAGRDPKALSLDFKSGRAVRATEATHVG